MKKNFYYLSLMFGLVFGMMMFTACGGGDDEDDANNGTVNNGGGGTSGGGEVSPFGGKIEGPIEVT